MSIPYLYVGCDVSKDWLDIFDPKDGRSWRIANTAQATARFADGFAGTNAFVVFEATGSYDRLLRTALHRANVANARLNPTMVRRYAQARGRKAKTDALDASMLADLGERLRPEPDPVPCADRARLATLAARRDQLVSMRAMEKTRLCEAHDPFVCEDLESAIARLSTAITRIDAEIDHQIQSHESLRTRVWTHKMNVNGGSNGTEQQGRTRKAGFCPVERSDEAGQRHLTVLKGYDRFTWLQRCKTLKTGRFPSVFRLVSNQIGSYHLHAFYRSTP